MSKLIYDIGDLVRTMDIHFLNLISYVYLGSSVLVFLILVCGITAPYGRYSRDGWGFQINAKIAWFVQEIPTLAIAAYMGACRFNQPESLNTPNLILFSGFFVHYIHRAGIFPFLIKGGKPSPLTTFVVALVFCIVNGYLHSAYLLYNADYGHDWWIRPHFWIGSSMFVSGMAINIRSDHILRTLRKTGETGYKIPTGGMFEYISGANFFGEMLEWTGFAVATWSLPGLAFAVWTCSNLGPRAYQHHTYYIQKFEDYPKNRKAVIPFVL